MQAFAPRAVLCLAMLVTVTACVGGGALRMGPVDEMIPPQPDRCGLADLPADLPGQQMAELARFPLAARLRVLWPGQEVTDEIRPDRINAEVDVQGRIRRLFCG